MSDGRGLRSFRALLRRWVREDTADPVAEAAPAEAADQGAEWSNFINRELDREYSRRDTVNTRAAAAVTSATTLITVTLAVLGVAKGSHYVIDGPLLLGLLAAALLLLLVAALLSIVAGAVGRGFRVASEKDMRKMLSAELWPAHSIDVRWHTAELNITAIKTLRAGTSRKYRYLVTAHVVQATGVLLLGVFAVRAILG